MKKTITVIICILAVLSLALCASAADPKTKCTLSKSNIKVGDSFTVTVSLENCPAVQSMGITPVYDSEIFKLTGAEWLVSDAVIKDFNTQKGDGAIIFNQAKSCNGNIFRFTLQAVNSPIFENLNICANLIAKTGDNNTVTVTADKTNVKITQEVEQTQNTTSTTTPPVTNPITNTEPKPDTTITPNTDKTPQTTPSDSTDTPNTNGDTTGNTGDTQIPDTTGPHSSTGTPDKNNDKTPNKDTDKNNKDITGESSNTITLIVIICIVIAVVGGGLFAYFKFIKK